MAAENNLTVDFVKAQSIDFAEQFGKNLKTLTEAMGIYALTPMPIGSTIKTYTSKVTLAGAKVPKGDIIPLSQVKMEEGDPIELNYGKHRKAVALEDIQKYGFERAVTMTDDKLVKELQKEVRDQLFENLKKGTGTATGAGLQAAIAQGWGKVNTAFEEDDVKVVTFANVMDVAKYLGTAQIDAQTAFGMSYLEKFLGTTVLFFSSQIPEGTAYMTASGNLNMAYVDVRGEISKAFDFVTDETGLIGVTKDVNKQRLTAETITLSGLALYAERLDGVVKVTMAEPTPAGTNG